MAQTIDMKAIRRLSADERYELIDRILDTLWEDGEIRVPPEVKREMERRVAEMKANPSKCISHDEMMRRLDNLRR
jgi:putative addiction module component (TIGR02574 family)